MNRKVLGPALLIVSTLVSLPAARAQTTQAACTPGISFWKLLDSVSVGYPFTVKGSLIEFQGKQIREKTDPMTYIVDYLSGGRYHSWWLKRESANK